MAVDLAAICTGLAARFAPGTISTPSGSPTLVGMRASLATRPKDVNAFPMVYLAVDQGSIVANPGQWKHEISIDVMFLLSKRQADPARVDAQRERWLGTLLTATTGQMKLGLGNATGYSVDKAIPASWEFTEDIIGAVEYDAIRVNYTVYVTSTEPLTP